MINLFHACCSSILSRTVHFSPLWKTSFKHSGVKTVNLELLLIRSRVRCYSSKKSSAASSRKPKIDPIMPMKDEKEAFFVVRKGDLVGVYKSLSDCQAQVGTSILDPPVSVFKGHSMPKDTEKYLDSCGLKNALYSIKASDLTKTLFGPLEPCPLQVIEPCPLQVIEPCPLQLSSSGDEISSEPTSKKRSHEATLSNYGQSCTLEFDGASKGNPGQAGAGVILRSDDGNLICRVREGLGVVTNNVAEYRAFILGLRCALGKGFTSVRVRGDSKLVCMQIQGLWKAKNQNISTLCEEAKKLKDMFLSFQISHILRDFNSEADAQANLGVALADGQVQEEIDK